MSQSDQLTGSRAEQLRIALEENRMRQQDLAREIYEMACSIDPSLHTRGVTLVSDEREMMALLGLANAN